MVGSMNSCAASIIGSSERASSSTGVRGIAITPLRTTSKMPYGLHKAMNESMRLGFAVNSMVTFLRLISEILALKTPTNALMEVKSCILADTINIQSIGSWKGHLRKMLHEVMLPPNLSASQNKFPFPVRGCLYNQQLPGSMGSIWSTQKYPHMHASL